MPLPTAITDLSTTAASNYPAGSDSPNVLDDVQRAHASFIAQLYATQTATILRGYLVGCTMSTAGSSATMTIAAGVAMDSTNAYLMSLSAINKTTSSWAVGNGNGGLDTGAIANNTTYHFYVIRRTDTGVVDVVFSTSATSPTLPASYTQYRLIGSMKTNGSAQWVTFTQVGDNFYLGTQVNDYASAAHGISTTLVTLSIPSGRQLQPILSGVSTNATTANITSQVFTPSTLTGEQLISFSLPNSGYSAFTGIAPRTNTSAQIAVISSVASTTIILYTGGWIDTRGRNT